MLLRNSWTCIPDGYVHAVFVRRCAESDGTLRWRVTDGVGRKILQRLFEPSRVTKNARRARSDVDVQGNISIAQ